MIRDLKMFLATLAIISFHAVAVSGLTISYCSGQNTGSSYSPVNNHYQSNGACYDTCSGSYAFAIVQGPDCWCSNYIPEDTTAVSSCNSQCPGFPTDTCGNTDLNLYGYISLTISPSGTFDTAPPTVSIPIPADSLSTVSVTQVSIELSTLISTVFVHVSSSEAQTSTILTPVSIAPFTVPLTVLETVTAAASVQISTIDIIAPTSSPSSVSAPPPSPTPIVTTTSNPTPTTSWDTTPYASVVTITGLVQTVTITPTAPPVASITVQAEAAAASGFFSDTGKVVGVFVLVALVIVGGVFGFLWCLCCRGRNRNTTTSEDNGEPSTLSRRSSRFSHLGFSIKRRTGDWGDLPTISTAGLNNPNSNEKSPVDTVTPNSRRASTNRLTIVDQRLDPDRIMYAEDEHGRVGSIKSFRDDRDYSRRMLRVANPDDD